MKVPRPFSFRLHVEPGDQRCRQHIRQSHQHHDQPGDRSLVAADIAARSSQINFIVELVAAGLGVGFLPRLIAEQRQRPGVSHALVVEPEIAWHMAWIWRRSGYLSHAGKARLDLAAEVAPKS